MKNCTLMCLAVVVLCCSLSGCGQRKHSADIRSNWNNINIESRHRKHDGMQQDFGEPHCPLQKRGTIKLNCYNYPRI